MMMMTLVMLMMTRIRMMMWMITMMVKMMMLMMATIRVMRMWMSRTGTAQHYVAATGRCQCSPEQSGGTFIILIIIIIIIIIITFIFIINHISILHVDFITPPTNIIIQSYIKNHHPHHQESWYVWWPALQGVHCQRPNYHWMEIQLWKDDWWGLARNRLWS